VAEHRHGHAGQSVPAKVKQQATGSPDRMTLDEEAFQQLLEAAYVMQQHNDAAASENLPPDPARTLTQVVELQEQLRSGDFDLQGATDLIAEHLQRMTSASGVAIGIARDGQLEFGTSLGTGVNAQGSRLSIDSGLADLFPPSDEGNNGAEPRAIPARNAAHQGLQSLVVLPVHYESKVAGILEVRFADDTPPHEHVIQTCHLMKGLIGEAISRAAELEWKRTLAAERATVIEALEKIKDRLAAEPAAKPASPVPEKPRFASPAIQPAKTGRHAEAKPETKTEEVKKESHCRICGYKYADEEMFCGNCGTARSSETGDNGLQSKWASMWRMKQAAERKQEENAEEQASPASEPPKALAEKSGPEGGSEQAPITALATQGQPIAVSPVAVSPWSSATHAREWLESMRSRSRRNAWFSKNKANLYLLSALFILVVVLSGWGTRRVQDQIASIQQQSGQPHLTAFEKLLVSLGLAELPAAPANPGNPNTQVWVDLHTALYYCPGSDLYGKTPGGKFTSQHDAQQDQFQPAAQKSCD